MVTGVTGQPSGHHVTRGDQMIRAMRTPLIAVAAAGMLLLPACGSDSKDATSTTADGGGTETTGGGDAGSWAVDTSNCPDDATAPIKGTSKIGTTLPLSGGPAAAAFAPVAQGLQK
jgi:hypothetical protein